MKVRQNFKKCFRKSIFSEFFMDQVETFLLQNKKKLSKPLRSKVYNREYFQIYFWSYSDMEIESSELFKTKFSALSKIFN